MSPTSSKPKTLGEALIGLLEAHGVDTVFGIPGVHTVELYRGLARSNIRHVTPRQMPYSFCRIATRARA